LFLTFNNCDFVRELRGSFARHVSGVLFALLTISVRASGPLYEPLAGFELGPNNPLAGVIGNSNGEFYGTSSEGGAYGFGTVYKMNASGDVSVLVHFTGTSGTAKGRRPFGRLVQSIDGKLWGTTIMGGTQNCGTIFSLDPATNSLTTVVEFTGTTGNAKGSSPQELTFDGDGNLWGGTTSGGANGDGTVFNFDPVQNIFSTIVEFTGNGGSFPGAHPSGALAVTPDGFLWGATSQGGLSDAGTIFKVSKNTGAFTNIRKFTFSGGYEPAGGLLYDGGYVWGTTYRGSGVTFDTGTVYRVNTVTGQFNTVGTTKAPGGAVKGELVKDAEGQFWGATAFGGAGNAGTIFKIDPFTGLITTVHEFFETDVANGREPNGSLWLDANGTFWGTAHGGIGGGLFGIVFKIVPATGFAVTHRFSSGRQGCLPSVTLTASAADWLWGTTEEGGTSNYGTVFKFHPSTRQIVTTAEFKNGDPIKGVRPTSGLISDAQGNLYGTTLGGGTQGTGTIFRISEESDFSTLAECTTQRGYPRGLLLRDALGNLWGTGSYPSYGVVLKIDASTNQLTTAFGFTGTIGARMGTAPWGGLVADQNGAFWGTTSQGGSANSGTVFKWDPVSGVYTLVAEFTGTMPSIPGKQPRGCLTLDEAGFIWGTTYEGGDQGLGTIFKVNASSGQFTIIAHFSGISGAVPGGKPMTGFAIDEAGFLWGCSSAGGAYNAGTIFKISRAGAFTHVFDFTGNDGSIPGKAPGLGTLIRHVDGKIYGTTTSGGIQADGRPAGGGQIFRITPALYPVEQWKLAHFNDAHASDSSDPDRDNVVTLAEYALLRNPQEPEAAVSPPVAGVTYPDGNRLRMTVPRDPGRDDITIEIQAGNGVAGPFITVASSVRGAPFSGPGYVTGDSVDPGLKQVEIRDTVDMDSALTRFMRVRVIRH
jgi:uncharacterized repeat protein (TIGR03803 family)